MKPRILILSDFYLPGYKSGGAVRTLASMVERMSDEFEFSVITRNHDGWGDFEPYQSVNTDQWNEIAGIQVYYFGKNGISASLLKKTIKKTAPDLVFLVSFFSGLTTKTLMMRMLGQLPQIPFILAPQGELADGSRQIKAAKKKYFIAVTRRAGIYRNIVWKASGIEEKKDITKTFGDKIKIEIVPDLTPKEIAPNYSSAAKPEKKTGELNLIFLSRLNRKKNLAFALDAVKDVAGKINFDVYGAQDDQKYLTECRELIAELPANISVQVHGSIDYQKVGTVLRRNHFFILPTLNENFGHVVLEALSAGCPVLLSDNTPWRQLSERRIGWDLSLDDKKKWRNVLQLCAEMNYSDYSARSTAAREFAENWLASPEVESSNRNLFRRLLENKR